MIKAYRITAYLIAAFVALQAATISMASFGLIEAAEAGITSEAVEAGDYAGAAGLHLHEVGAYVTLALALLLFGLAFAVKGEAVKWAGIVLGISVVQYGLGEMAGDMPWIGALHGINALGIFAMALVAARKVAAQASVAA